MKCIIDDVTIIRTLRRISHEIIEKCDNLNNVVFLGIKSKGYPVAKVIKENILNFEHIDIPLYEFDIAGYRDDYKVSAFEKLNLDLEGKTVILIDDVLYTGRSVRAAMDAVVDLGRPNKIQLAVLIDRGHRELPIRADYVGKNIPTSSDEIVIVNIEKNSGVFIIKK